MTTEETDEKMFDKDMRGYDSLGELADLLEGLDHVFIRQKVMMLEAITMGCVEQKNIYTVLTPEGDALMTCREVSDFKTRCCCNPLHSLTIEIFKGIGGGDGNDDAFFAGVGSNAVQSSDEALYTAERPGCCCGKPGLCCPACTDHCTDAMVLHAGHVKGYASDLESPEPLLMIRQEMAYESPFHPALEIMPAMDGANNGFAKATHMINGPMCFGGCVELCCESNWIISDKKSKSEDGRIIKQKPASMKDALREMATDADLYRLDFTVGMGNAAKAALITSTLLLDYMFFERDMGVCKPTVGEGGLGCSTTLFNCYCCGCICPCTCSTGNNDGHSGHSE
ncbi:hypothetical protein TrLO_g1388 [Triparma laevis f. longispina]|uniref:Phospholipid scramblase n=1 Tax=Triparma laevis f. longispina TaxID=1714387 RepID=A0A9W7FTJ9_9STRA|nr:hypothetical protein TrLO_g1388 [Triparma laevis f. longispina]